MKGMNFFFFFSSRRRHTRSDRDWSSDVCSSDLTLVKLYGYFRSSAAFRVRIALNLKNISYEMQSVHLSKDGGHNRKPEYRAVNPQMKVPALVLDSGETLIQSLAIMDYLEET